MIRKLGIIVAGLIALLSLSLDLNWRDTPQDAIPLAKQPTRASDSLLLQAFENRQSDLQIEGSGIVVKILPDDLQGSRHQRFLLKLSHGQVLLIAHNIDLAPRIDKLHEDERVAFYGEYEWNEKGGVIHWTHHDPGKKHNDGWLKHKGRTYQ
ncbi:MAG: DUF3465 domain-containing protein [Amphritea sp.]